MSTTRDSNPRDEIDRTLRARARALAQAREQATQKDEIEVVEFRLAHERYAFEASSVHGVRPLRELTPLPCTPAFFMGIVNAGGRLVPVIDLKSFFDLPSAGITDLHHVVLLRNEITQLGVLADSIESAYGVPLDSIQASLATLTGIRGEYLRGVTADRLVILDSAAILADPRLIVDEEVAR